MSKQINFGDYAIVDAHEYHFEKAPEIWWKILPVTSGHELARSKFIAHNRTVIDAAGNSYDQPPTVLEIAHREIALLYGGCSLVDKEENKPVLRENPTIAEIEAVLYEMPPEMVGELWVKIGELYPKWGPLDPKAWKTEPTSSKS